MTNLAKAIFLQALYQHADFNGVSRSRFTWRAVHLINNWNMRQLALSRAA